MFEDILNFDLKHHGKDMQFDEVKDKYVFCIDKTYVLNDFFPWYIESIYVDTIIHYTIMTMLILTFPLL